MKQIKTGKNYFETLKEIQKGSRMTTAAEELKIALSCKPQEDIKKNYLMPNGDWIWLWTSTALRKPKDYDENPSNNVKKINGKKYYFRMLVEGDEVVGSQWIPELGIVTKWNKKTGLPLETEPQTDENIKKIHTHFWFDENCEEVAVVRGCDWHHVERCLDVDANYSRWDTGSDVGFRPVRGSLKKEKHKHEFICKCGEKK